MNPPLFSNLGFICSSQEIFGTGTLIDPHNKLLLTAYHVVESKICDETQCFFAPFASPEVLIRIIDFVFSSPSNKNDVALLKLSAHPYLSGLPSAKISFNLLPNDDVWCIGYVNESGLERSYKTAIGKCMGLTNVSDISFYEIEMGNIYKGMSGASVFKKDEIIGILTQRDYGLNDSVVARVTPVEYIYQSYPFLESPTKSSPLDTKSIGKTRTVKQQELIMPLNNYNEQRRALLEDLSLETDGQRRFILQERIKRLDNEIRKIEEEINLHQKEQN